MAKTKRFYRCENEFGEDPCLYARENYRIPEEEVTQSMGDEPPKCPGKTISGEICGHKLISIGGKAKRPGSGEGKGKKIAIAIGGIAVVAAVVFLFLFPKGSPQLQVSQSTLTFPYSKSGESDVALIISNPGDAELVIDEFEVSSSDFSLSESTLRVAPGKEAVLTIHFQASSSDMQQGELLLRSNAGNETSPVILIANVDPWTVYDKLDANSQTLKEQ